MAEQPTPQIRPFWVIGGGLAIVLFAACGLIFIGIAAIIIWLSTPSSSNTDLPTQGVAQRQTEPAIVIVPTSTAATPTPLPRFSTLAPSTPVILVPTTSASQRTAPDQAVRMYYQLVSGKRFDLTWQLLTDAFKQKFNCCAPSYNYTDYAAWWNSVSRVEFGTVNTVSQNGDRAVVYAEIYFVMNTGARSAVDTNPYIALVYDSVLGAWRFEDKRAAA